MMKTDNIHLFRRTLRGPMGVGWKGRMKGMKENTLNLKIDMCKSFKTEGYSTTQQALPQQT